MHAARFEAAASFQLSSLFIVRRLPTLTQITPSAGPEKCTRLSTGTAGARDDNDAGLLLVS